MQLIPVTTELRPANFKPWASEKASAWTQFTLHFQVLDLLMTSERDATG